MRRARLTYEGAWHHVMNRGYDGLPVFQDESLKKIFLEKLSKLVNQYKVRILAFCIMDNHYHIVLQNCTGKMPAFLKALNGEFAGKYRHLKGGRGYVFQDRYKSMLIQDESYLMLTIAYVLNNPVCAGMVETFDQYPWSSLAELEKKLNLHIVDREYLLGMFNGEGRLKEFIYSRVNASLPIVFSKMGALIGGEDFLEVHLARSDRRKNGQSEERRRIKDCHFFPLDQIMQSFEKKHGIDVNTIDTRTFAGKRLRAELLVLIKDNTGLTYREIVKLPLFSSVSLGTLGAMYKNQREKNRQKIKE